METNIAELRVYIREKPSRMKYAVQGVVRGGAGDREGRHPHAAITA